MIKVTELRPGDTILGWMRIGYALKKGRTATGVIYRFVPSKAEQFDQDDLQQFTGIVVSNDTVNYILRVEAARMNRYTMAAESPLPAEIHYSSIQRLRRLSKTANFARQQNPLRPTAVAIGTGYYPYRTAEEVQLRWK